jgi:hypothetical protein
MVLKQQGEFSSTLTRIIGRKETAANPPYYLPSCG